MEHVYDLVDGEMRPTWTWQSVRDMKVSQCFQSDGMWVQKINHEVHGNAVVVKCKSLYPIE